MNKIQKTAAMLLSAGVISGGAITMASPSAQAARAPHDCTQWYYQAKDSSQYFAYAHGTQKAAMGKNFIYKGSIVRTKAPFYGNPRTQATAVAFDKVVNGKRVRTWWNLESNGRYPYIAKADFNYLTCH